MKKTYILAGLDCPHCSAEIEKDIGKIKGVTYSNVNMVSQTLTVELDSSYSGDIFKDVEKTVHKHEPDVEVCEKSSNKKHSHGEETHHEHKHGEHCNCEHQYCDSEYNHEHYLCEEELSHKYHLNIDSHEPLHPQNYRKNSEEHHPLENSFFSADNSKEKIFILQGLDCAHCSAEIEKDTAKLDGVTAATVNLVKQLLTVEYTADYKGDIFKDIEKVVHKYEPDVEVIEKTNSKAEKTVSSAEKKKPLKKAVKSDKGTAVRFAVGAVIYAVGFVMSLIGGFGDYVLLPIFIAAYLILGYDVLLKAFKNILKGRIFDENFLMTVSTVGAFVIGEYPEAVAVMLFYQIGEFFQSLAVKRSRKSITGLMDIRPDSANVKRSGKLLTVSPEDVEVGETIVIKPGEKIPLDGVVTDGESMVNTTALTGESVPRKVKSGDAVLSGCINENGVLTVKVTKAFEESTAAKILELVENAAGRKAPTENFITTFSRYYTPVVVIMAALLAIVPPLLLGGGWVKWVRRCFVFLVISCPCALVISIPLTFFGGIGAASKKGVLVKGSNYLEALNAVETIVFDKTGTLTKGVFEVTNIAAADGFSQSNLLEFAAKAESMSNHPIARSIVRAYKKDIDKKYVKNYSEISGHGVSAFIDGHNVLAGNEKLMVKNGIEFKKSDKIGTVVYVAVDGKFAGCIVISDEIKSDSKSAVEGLKKLGIAKTVMLTGDSTVIAESVAAEVGVTEYYGELLPDQKVAELERLDGGKSAGKKLAFVGDGINDAPVLARADVGIAMGALGSDAAIEAADVVLMTDEPSKLIDAIKVAGYTKKIVMQNIVFVIAVKVLFLVLGAFGIAGMWEAVFGDVGVMIIAVINSMRILSIK